MSLINTRIQDIRAKANLDKNETRPSQYGGLNLFMEQSMDANGILSPELIEKAQNSIGSTLATPVIDYDGTVTIGNTRSLTIADSENTSQMYTINFATYSWGFTMVPALYLNNEIGEQRDFETKFKKYLYKFASTLDSAAIAAISTGKTQVFNDLLNYTQTGNIVQAPWRYRENIIGDIEPMLEANDHFGEIHFLGNAGMRSTLNRLSELGSFNQEDKQYQWDNKIVHFSNRVSNEVEDYGNLYAVVGGSLGMLTRFDREALRGTKMENGREWGISTLPLLNMPVGTMYYQDAVNASGIAGAASADMTASFKEFYGFSVDVAFLTPYNSDPTTIANPIMQVALLKETAADYTNIIVANADTDPVPTKEQP